MVPGVLLVTEVECYHNLLRYIFEIIFGISMGLARVE